MPKEISFERKELDLKGRWRQVRGIWTEKEDTIVYEGNEDPGNPDGLYVNDVAIQDGEISAEIRLQTNEPEKDPNAHFVFHYQGVDDYHFAGIGAFKALYVIASRTPYESQLRQPGWTPWIQDGRISQLRPNQWYPLKVSFISREIELQVGDVPVLSWTTRYQSPKGNVGLRGWGSCQVEFRNIRAFQNVRRADVGSRLESIKFDFMYSPILRSIAERDCNEVRTLDADVTPKAVTVMLGSIVEAILLDALQADEQRARSANKAPRTRLARWHFNDMIEVAHELNIVADFAYALSHVLRGYRNLIHPGNKRVEQGEPGTAQAAAAIDFLLAVIEDRIEP